MVLNVVGHVVHPPEHLAAWPDDDHASRLVLIVRGLERDALQRSLDAFLALGGAPSLSLGSRRAPLVD